MAGRVTPERSGRCSVAADLGDPALPVAGTGKLRQVRKSTNAKRRALVLIGVHVLVAAHVTHYLLAGWTVSPIEPSEAMYTLELRQINAGFIFILLALLGTLVFGRFFCGWGCHIVALQDLCAWMMKKLGIRPRPFRARLLLWGPAALAFYMFFWPSLNRWMVTPLLVHWGWFDAGGLPPLPGFTNHLTTDAFWKTFPGPLFAVLTFATCGFAAVYFLGAKGFCSYGCPYGALFAAAERVAPFRIVVSDACEQCGHCTATCTSNVLVHEEVRRFGMVVDPGCMKCMDCVSVCPKGALSLGLARPTLFRRRPEGQASVKRYTLGWGQELLLVTIGLAAFLAFRGLYDGPPMLMSAGLGALTAFVALKLWQVLREPTVRVQNLNLKVSGEVRRAGWVFTTLAVVWLLFSGHSAMAQWHRARGSYYLNRSEISRADGLTGAFVGRTYSAQHRRAMEQARRHFTWADRWGLVDVPEVKLGLAWTQLLADDVDEAVTTIREALAKTPTERKVHADLVQLLLSRGRLDDAADAFGTMVRSVEPTADELFRLAGILVQTERYDEAVQRYRESLALIEEPATLYNLGGLLRRLGHHPEAIPYLERASVLLPLDADTRVELGLAYMETGRTREAIDTFRIAIQLAPETPESRLHLPGLIEQMERSAN